MAIGFAIVLYAVIYLYVMIRSWGHGGVSTLENMITQHAEKLNLGLAYAIVCTVVFILTLLSHFASRRFLFDIFAKGRNLYQEQSAEDKRKARLMGLYGSSYTNIYMDIILWLALTWSLLFGSIFVFLMRNSYSNMYVRVLSSFPGTVLLVIWMLLYHYNYMYVHKHIKEGMNLGKLKSFFIMMKRVSLASAVVFGFVFGLMAFLLTAREKATSAEHNIVGAFQIVSVVSILLYAITLMKDLSVGELFPTDKVSSFKEPLVPSPSDAAAPGKSPAKS